MQERSGGNEFAGFRPEEASIQRPLPVIFGGKGALFGGRRKKILTLFWK
jgi:hypothetical protein